MPKAKNVEEYIARQEAAIASNPDCGTSHYNLAVALLGQKKYDEAEKELHEAIGCSPTLAEAYVQLGGISLQRGDLENCLYYNKQAVQTRAGFAEGYSNIGFVYLQQGKPDEAIPALEKAAIKVIPKAIAEGKVGEHYIKGWDADDESRIRTDHKRRATNEDVESALDYLNSDDNILDDE